MLGLGTWCEVLALGSSVFLSRKLGHRGKSSGRSILLSQATALRFWVSLLGEGASGIRRHEAHPEMHTHSSPIPSCVDSQLQGGSFLENLSMSFPKDEKGSINDEEMMLILKTQGKLREIHPQFGISPPLSHSEYASHG